MWRKHWPAHIGALSLSTMDTPITDPGNLSHRESAADQNARLVWEAAGIAEAQADLEAGNYVDAADVDAWIDSIGSAHELPPPPIRRR